MLHSVVKGASTTLALANAIASVFPSISAITIAKFKHQQRRWHEMAHTWPIHFRARWTEQTSRSTSTPMLCLRYAVFILLLFATGSQSYQEENIMYMSRPDLKPPTFNFTIYNSSHVTPGYWFMAPWNSVRQPAPYIFDNRGNLVWSGYMPSDTRAIFNFKPVFYNQSTFMTFFRGNMIGGTGSGSPVIMDSSYNTNTPATLGKFDIDGHEFYVTNEGRSAIMTKFEPVNYDLSAFNMTTGMGWILESTFKEVDTETGQILFEWRSLDHIDPSESAAVLNLNSHTGLAYESAWDYFHLNSVEKTSEGDYIISGRHTSCIYKISRFDGSIIWRLGGRNSSFATAGFNFSYQHDARIQEDNSTTTIISFLDNDSAEAHKKTKHSSGMIVALDKSSSPMTARLLRQYVSPRHPLVASQGNVQVLPNQNVFISWGNNGSVSEFTSDGNCVLQASSLRQSVSYRSYKFNFTAFPTDLPAIWTYSLNKASPTAFYVSWNGATEVASWNFYALPDNPEALPIFLGAAEKSGFETMYITSKFYAQAFAEAVAANGTSLANSTTKFTFVPPSTLANACTQTKCVASKVQHAKDDREHSPIPPHRKPDPKKFDPSPYLTPSNTALIVVALIMVAENGFLAWRRFSKGRREEADLRDYGPMELHIPLLVDGE